MTKDKTNHKGNIILFINIAPNIYFVFSKRWVLTVTLKNFVRGQSIVPHFKPHIDGHKMNVLSIIFIRQHILDWRPTEKLQTFRKILFVTWKMVTYWYSDEI